MSGQNFESRRVSLSELLTSRNTYEVPSHQRDYSWEKDEIEIFWSDLLSIFKEKSYYFGSIIVQESKDEKIKIILDGQQRLATATILLAVIRDIFFELRDMDGAQEIQKHFILDKLYKEEHKKLTLNLRNKDFFYYCIQKSPTDDERQNFDEYERKNTLYKTNKLLRNAYYSFESKIKKEIKNKDKEKSIDFLTKLSANLTDKFMTIMITVNSEEEAYMIFETINDRGLDLSVADLFKNYLIRKAISREKEDVVRIWQDIVGMLDDKVRPFLRHYWSSKFQKITERKLFSMLKKYIEDRKSSVRSFVKELKEEAVIYSALLKPQLEYWQDKEIIDLLEDFNALDITQCLILLMSARSKFNNKNFKNTLRLIINFAVRYSTICNRHNNVLEDKYSEIGKRIRKGSIKNADDTRNLLLELYPSDDDFTESFKAKQIKKATVARYILKRIDICLGNYSESFDYSSLSLEHIIPKALTKEWRKYLIQRGLQEKEIKEHIFKIGNLTLLDVTINRSAATYLFKKKKKLYYKKSRLELNKYFMNIKEWDSASIERRQLVLCNAAKKIWKI